MFYLSYAYIISFLGIFERLVITDGALTPASSLDMSCPCDLNTPKCDIGCCCDQDCSSVEKASAKCLPGVFGGDLDAGPPPLSCDSQWPERQDYDVFFCVHTNNSPFLGAFSNYTAPVSVDDVPEFNSMAQTTKKTIRTYQITPEPSASNLDNTFTYDAKEDTPIQRKDTSTLSLPTAVFNGLCSYSVPVVFMRDQSSECFQPCLPNLCANDSILSAQNYLSYEAAVYAGTADTTLAEVEMIYWCVSDVASFMTSVGNVENITTNCTSDYSSTPSLFASGNSSEDSFVCTNVVLKVSYEFQYKAKKIEKVIVSVYIGELNFTEQCVIKQQFSASFVHWTNTTNSSTVITQRSGNPGYLMGSKILSLNVENTSTLWQNKNTTPGQMLILSQGDLSCAGSQPITFGENVMSGCVKKLTVMELSNCTQLRRNIQQELENAITATHVGKTGNAVPENEADWIEILRTYKEKNDSDADLQVGSCTDVPAHMIVQFLYTEAGKSIGLPQYAITGVRISYRTETWNMTCLPGESCGLYPNITETAPLINASSSIVASNDSVSTSASSISPTSTIPSVDSSSISTNQTSTNVTSPSETPPDYRGMLLGMLQNGTGIGELNTKNFVITSSFTFVYVSPSPAIQPKRSEDASGTCRWDSCLEYLFYPFTEQYLGEKRPTAIAYGLLLVFLIIGVIPLLWNY